MKKITLSLLLLCCILPASMTQNALLISKVDGSSQAYLLGEIKKITFSNESIVFHNSSEQLYNLSTIQKLSFTTISSVDKLKTDDAITLYPNPAHSFVSVKGHITKDSSYSIFDMQGKLHLQAKLNEKQSITVDKLRTGLYILKIDNRNLKFNKL
ncbi:MAG: T9SS type A sorting domain-containing protein [Paludibacteraceae bacterium]|nr:T9SS type A sorting domain-containing protein [Paludibacteraceae bacterium]